MKSKQKLNYSDTIFCKEVVKTKNPTLAILNLHPEITNKKVASAMARQKIESSSQIRLYISQQLDKQGLSLIEANNRLKRNLDATRPIVVKDEIVDYPDYNARLNAIDRVYKLHGLLKSDIVQDNRQVNISLESLSGEEVDRLDGILHEMQSLASRVDMSKNKILPQPTDTQGVTE